MIEFTNNSAVVAGSVMCMSLITDRAKIPAMDPQLAEQYSEYALLYKDFSVDFFMKDCPLGFYFSESQRCTCQEIIIEHGIECDAVQLLIIKTGQAWINTTLFHTLETSNVIVHA